MDPEVVFRKLKDVDGLYAVIGDTMFLFMKIKSNIFPNATLSKEDFWLNRRFKRAMTWVFLLRHVLGFKSHKQWNNFSEKDYKLNTRAFKRWSEKERQIMEASPLYRAMPNEFDASVAGDKAYKKRKAVPLVGSATESPKKKVFVVGDDTTTEEEDVGNEDKADV